MDEPNVSGSDVDSDDISLAMRGMLPNESEREKTPSQSKKRFKYNK